MTILRLIKNNETPCRIAMSALGFFEMKVASKQEITEVEKELRASLCVKFKYVLRAQPSICFNLQLHCLKKNP